MIFNSTWNKFEILCSISLNKHKQSTGLKVFLCCCVLDHSMSHLSKVYRIHDIVRMAIILLIFQNVVLLFENKSKFAFDTPTPWNALTGDVPWSVTRWSSWYIHHDSHSSEIASKCWALFHPSKFHWQHAPDCGSSEVIKCC